ncbi:glycosyltransferase [Vagococcus fluvialis]|uniref:Glycosyltransferase n=1 Tax=Vagococcus fluvialis TaxID=2738 RepID=A0A7X6D6V7_9ENTE|nr:glycosyltransferase [Vagococcus fluvialis]NKC66915.1 glycosyltransferase [Vagococcus fluvialis]
MLFSIIIPVYNIEDYILSTLKSVEKQEEKNFEVLVIDDGSTDKSGEFCIKFCDNKPNWRYYYKENGGLSDARNFGIEKAKGKYLIFVDGDDTIDFLTTSFFSSIVEKNDYDVISGLARRIDDNKEEIFKISLNENEVLSGKNYLIKELSNETMNMAVWLRIYKKDFIIKNNLFFKFGRLHEDEEWTPRVMVCAKSVYVTHFIFYNYIIREGSITQKKNKNKNGLDIIKSMNELDSFFIKNNEIEVRESMGNHIVFQCLNGFQMLDPINRKKKLWNSDFLKNRSLSQKNKYKLYLFNFSKNLYYTVYKLLRN